MFINRNSNFQEVTGKLNVYFLDSKTEEDGQRTNKCYIEVLLRYHELPSKINILHISVCVRVCVCVGLWVWVHGRGHVLSRV